MEKWVYEKTIIWLNVIGLVLKLTFGLLLSCAFCGVPGIYMKKKPMLVTILAPFVVFDVIFGVGFYFAEYYSYGVAWLALMLLASHVCGCVGDLYGTFIMICKMPDDVLISDSGPKQVFYTKE